jgi:glycosyltransferase involved in cell wall biosynthesis
MRVLLLTSARAWRGSGVSLGKIASGLAGRGHQVCACAGHPDVIGGFAGLGLRTAPTPTGDTGLRQIRALRRRLREFACDAILVDKLRDLRLAGWAGLGLPVAIMYRYNIGPSGPAPGLPDRLALGRTRMCLFQSEQVRAAAQARTPALARIPSRVIYNGYDTARYRPDPAAGAAFRARYGLPAEALVALTLSALERAKGQDVALEALERLYAEGVRVTYVIAGDGKHAEQVRRRAEESVVPTVLTGFLRGDDVVGALNAADLYLHPAREEIFPNAVAEAMACGRPVIATGIGGVSELMGPDDQSGVQVRPGDADALAGAIRRCAADEGLRARLGAAGRRRIEGCFPVSAMVEGYERALLAAVGG